jgi:hypothetical protein
VNTADVPPVARPGSSPDSQSISPRNGRDSRRRRGQAGRGKTPPLSHQGTTEDDLAVLPTPTPGASDDAGDGHLVDVRA